MRARTVFGAAGRITVFRKEAARVSLPPAVESSQIQGACHGAASFAGANRYPDVCTPSAVTLGSIPGLTMGPRGSGGSCAMAAEVVRSRSTRSAYFMLFQLRTGERRWPRQMGTRDDTFWNGGEGGIRTPGRSFPLRRFSKPLLSTTQPPLREMQYGPKKHTDRKSTRLNSSHLGISYAVFCLKKKK